MLFCIDKIRVIRVIRNLKEKVGNNFEVLAEPVKPTLHGVLCKFLSGFLACFLGGPAKFSGLEMCIKRSAFGRGAAARSMLRLFSRSTVQPDLKSGGVEYQHLQCDTTMGDYKS